MPPTGTLCRLCLWPSPLLSSLFVDDRAQKLQVLTSIEVFESDPLTEICVNCLLNLNLGYKICQNMKQTDEKLREMWASQSNQESVVDVKAENIHADVFERINIVPSVKEPPDCIDSTFCMVCGNKMGRKHIHEHLRRHFKYSKTCRHCDQTFSNFSDYRNHVLYYHDDHQVKKCERCHRTFFYQSLYEVHLHSAHAEEFENEHVAVAPKKPESRRERMVVTSKKADSRREGKQGPFTCQECNKSFPTKCQARYHTHAKKPCPICNKAISQTNLRRHVENHTDTEKICDLCGNKFKNRDGLRTHIFYFHNKSRYKCDRCDLVFKKKNRRDLHIKRDHDESPPEFVCDICGKKFYTNRNLTVHKAMTHEKLRPWHCEFCNRDFSSRYALQTHRRQHTLEAPYKCEFCTESFRQRVSLRAHNKSKHNFVEKITCHCKTCGRGFATSVALMVHVRKDICSGQNK